MKAFYIQTTNYSETRTLTLWKNSDTELEQTMTILIFGLLAFSRFMLILNGSVVPPTPYATRFAVKTTVIIPSTTKTVAVSSSYAHMPDTVIKSGPHNQLILRYNYATGLQCTD